MDDLPQPSPRLASPASPTTSFQSQQRAYSRPFAKITDPPPGLAYHEYIRSWSDAHVARWLADIKCTNHASTFRANDIRGDVLLELDQLTLKEMGIASIGDRLRILNAVKALRHKSSAKSIPTPPPEHERPSLPVDTRPLKRDHGHERSVSENSIGSRLARRLDAGRPAPLQLKSSQGYDLPRLVRDRDGQLPDSAKSNTSTTSLRPLPIQAHTTTAAATATGTPTSNTSSTSVASITSNTSSTSSTSAHNNSASRSNLLVPPAPRSQPPIPPPGRAPPRVTGRRTPTQGDVPPYVNQPLPPAPQNPSLLTPVSANSSGNWGYGLPSDPRPGNTGGKTPVRATSPLNIQPRNFTRNANTNLVHGRNLSVTSPSSSSSPVKLPVRPMPGNSHPYAQGSSLLPIASQPSYNLSPIAETFPPQQPASSGSPSPPSQPGRPPFGRTSPYPNAPSLNDLRWKLVKFNLPEESHSCTINVADCSGVEVLEKVLKKVGKFGSRTTDADIMEHVSTTEGGLTVDGWGVYLDSSQGDKSGQLDHP